MSAAQLLLPQQSSLAPGAHETATLELNAVRVKPPATEARRRSAFSPEIATTASRAPANESEHAGHARQLAHERRAQSDADARRAVNDDREAAQLTPGEKVAQAEAARAAFPSLSDPGGSSTLARRAQEKTRQSELKAEALELARARNLLQQGRTREAAALLEAGSRRFATGMLGAERELLSALGFGPSGRGASARADVPRGSPGKLHFFSHAALAFQE